MPFRRPVAALASALVLALTLAACSGLAPGRPSAAVIPDRIELAVPTGAAPVGRCTEVNAGVPRAPLGLDLSFREDFDRLRLGDGAWLPHYNLGRDPDTGVWRGAELALNRTLAGNHEQQIYVDPAYAAGTGKPLGLDPFRIQDGVLSIVAERVPPRLAETLKGFDYTSGLLTSRASFVQRYGYFEMRARVPAGKALWPAFWLLAADRVWPPEIDILEVVGQQPELMVTTAHWSKADGKHGSSGCRTRLPDAWNSFHLFGALWTAERIVWFIDRVPVAQIATPAGFDKPMYLLLNLAVGGNMVGRADADTPVPAQFDVDWVAAWKLPGSDAAQ
ncbi:glycoside hydrolase family 16 protein [Derxia lacustris]|uniref:glycoside hydrolase family 16 protein n=1 Tax=Derxia lacustris TaxID=764842 RepID=UPI000A16E8D4|nr:glycoside hydrolase family 16 protein [Derxia lacustris]